LLTGQALHFTTGQPADTFEHREHMPTAIVTSKSVDLVNHHYLELHEETLGVNSR
jgi:hypothetical protein